LPWDDYQSAVAPEHAQATWEHISRSPSMSIAKARQRLGYQPRYSSMQTAADSLRWLAEHGEVAVDPARIPAAQRG
jgi:nucleoside-diphosphate-sugar epimerase